MKILLTGGAGYIGSHTATALTGHEVTILDNFSTSRRGVLDQIDDLRADGHAGFRLADLRDKVSFVHWMILQQFDAVIHFAALKSLPESFADPLGYYHNNVGGTNNLLMAMTACVRVPLLVFSSSAAVYAPGVQQPLREDDPTEPASPYGHTKLVCEKMIEASGIPHVTLRYFNPVGAHCTGLLGDTEGPALMPALARVASGRRASLSMYGDDWPTPDGSGVRDLIHVMDVAEAHVAALDYLSNGGASVTLNLGTGRGTSVLEAVAAMRRVSGRPIPVEVAPRRPGDLAEVWADPSRAEAVLGWKARRDLLTMADSAWVVENKLSQGVYF